MEAIASRKEVLVRYNITYRVGAEEFTDEVEAPDAATAASKIQFERGRSDDHFELISVQLLDPMETQPEPAEDHDPALK